MYLASLSTCTLKNWTIYYFVLIPKKYMFIVEILENTENYKQYNKSHEGFHYLMLPRIQPYSCRYRYK